MNTERKVGYELLHLLNYSFYKYDYPVRLENYSFYHDSPSHTGVFRHAVDIATPLPDKKMTTIHAPQNGVVIQSVMNNTVWGGSEVYEKYLNYITVLTDNKNEFYEIGHISPLNNKIFRRGDRITRGDVLGLVGLNGRITMYKPGRPASHVHMLVAKITDKGFESLKIRWN